MESGGEDSGVVLDDRERLVEVVEQLAPLLISGRSAEALGVVLERLPLHEEQVSGRTFQAAGQRQAEEAALRRDDLSRLGEGSLEVGLAAGDDGQDGLFEDHRAIVSRAPAVVAATTTTTGAALAPASAAETGSRCPQFDLGLVLAVAQ